MYNMYLTQHISIYSLLIVKLLLLLIICGQVENRLILFVEICGYRSIVFDHKSIIMFKLII